MGIKKLTPTSPSRRYHTYLIRDELTPGAEPEKSLLESNKRTGARPLSIVHVSIRAEVMSMKARTRPSADHDVGNWY